MAGGRVVANRRVANRVGAGRIVANRIVAGRTHAGGRGAVQALRQGARRTTLAAVLIGTIALSGCGDTPTRSPLPAAQPDAPADAAGPLIHGVATYYAATGDGACMLGPTPRDLLVAAMNAPQYGNAALCGAFVQVAGPLGTVVVRVVDLCPECRSGHLDLSREAFRRIAPMHLGRVAIRWRIVSPELPGPIAYRFKEGSNRWWTAVQIRNHRHPIAQLEYSPRPGTWISLPRTHYNYFVQTNPGMGPGPYRFRVTDAYGQVLEDHTIDHREGGLVPGAEQFPKLR